MIESVRDVMDCTDILYMYLLKGKGENKNIPKL